MQTLVGSLVNCGEKICQVRRPFHTLGKLMFLVQVSYGRHCLYMSTLITVIRVLFFQMFDLFDKVIEFNHNPTSESAKRKLDLVRISCFASYFEDKNLTSLSSTMIPDKSIRHSLPDLKGVCM